MTYQCAVVTARLSVGRLLTLREWDRAASDDAAGRLP